MFLNFFYMMRSHGLSVSLHEMLALYEAMLSKYFQSSIDDFYFLSKTILIKKETELDKFDQLFSEYFKGMESIGEDFFTAVPEEWLRKQLERFLTKEEMDKIKALGGLEALLKRFQELLKEQQERHQGGNKWIGTGGTSPFGAYGYNPQGIRMGQDGSRMRSAIKVWDKREFSNLDDSVELNTRNMKVALKHLRKFTREGPEDEFDLKKTIRKTSENAGMLDIQMVPSKKNRIKVLMFFDIGGSMDDHVELCNQLFSAVKYELKHLEYYYFHNCLYGYVWKDNQRRWRDRIPTLDVLQRFNKDYKVIFVGDAAMSPYEILAKGGDIEGNNRITGKDWLMKVFDQFEKVSWLNPTPERNWDYFESTYMIREIMGKHMYPLTITGLVDMIKYLKK